jgi:hypothetical protein
VEIPRTLYVVGEHSSFAHVTGATLNIHDP